MSYIDKDKLNTMNRYTMAFPFKGEYQYVYMTFKAETMLQVKDGVEVIISFQKANGAFVKNKSSLLKLRNFLFVFRLF